MINCILTYFDEISNYARKLFPTVIWGGLFSGLQALPARTDYILIGEGTGGNFRFFIY